MPFYRRRSRWPYRSWRRGYGASSGSKRGLSTFTCRIPLEDVLEFKIPATPVGGTPVLWSNLICTCPYAVFTTGTNLMNLSKGSLLASYLYRTYTKIYDQVKVNAVSVSIGLMEGVGNVGQLSALRLYTNWDRDFTFEELVGGSPSTPEQLATGSESQSYLIVNNSRQTFRRYIAARDVQERTTYHDCSYTVHTKNQGAGGALYNDGYYGDDAWAPLIVGLENGGANTTYAYGTSKSCGFTPTLMMAVWSPSSFAAERVIPVSLKVTYSVTFRMPKFGLGSASNAKYSDMRADAVADVMSEAEEVEKRDKSVAEIPVLQKHVKYEEEVLPDDDDEGMDDDSQPELTKEELLEMLKKFDEKKVSS